MDAKVIDVNGKDAGTVSLKEEIFGHKPEKRFLHEFVTIYLANQRAWTSNTKSRTTVSGGGRKPWKQKGTGRARAGSIRSGLWRHGAIIHGCHVGREVLVGMNAVVLDRAVIGDQSIIAAMALIKMKGQIPPRVLIAGVPGRVVRELSDEELRAKSIGTDQYVELARRSKAGIDLVQALVKVQADRPRTLWR